MNKASPVPGCGWTIAEGFVMCAQHWALLPDTLRRDLRNAQLREGSVAERRKLQMRIRTHFDSVTLS